MVTNDKFYTESLKGNLMKEIVCAMLQEAGYQVFPYGYEMTFTGLSEKLRYIPKERSETVRRIRASPDLLVYSPKKKVENGCSEVDDLMLVEVKMRSTHQNEKIRIDGDLIKDYKQFWRDSILLIVVPDYEIFYAQHMKKLCETKNTHLIGEFKKIQYMFTRLAEQNEVLTKYQKRAQLILDAIKKANGA